MAPRSPPHGAAAAWHVIAIDTAWRRDRYRMAPRWHGMSSPSPSHAAATPSHAAATPSHAAATPSHAVAASTYLEPSQPFRGLAAIDLKDLM
jgi:hypothetical protein